MEEQRSASRLLPYAKTSDALKAEYLPVGDGDNGYEHYYKWSYLTDERILDPEAPESLMYEVDFIAGKQTLAAGEVAKGEEQTCTHEHDPSD
jgi:hypothetical protein